MADKNSFFVNIFLNTYFRGKRVDINFILKPSLTKSTNMFQLFKYVRLYTLIRLGSNLQFYTTIQLYLFNIYIGSTFSNKFDINSIQLARLTSNLHSIQLFGKILRLQIRAIALNSNFLLYKYVHVSRTYYIIIPSIGTQDLTVRRTPDYPRNQCRGPRTSYLGTVQQN